MKLGDLKEELVRMAEDIYTGGITEYHVPIKRIVAAIEQYAAEQVAEIKAERYVLRAFAQEILEIGRTDIWIADSGAEHGLLLLEESTNMWVETPLLTGEQP